MYQKKSRRYYERQPSSLLVRVRYFLGSQDEVTEETKLIDLSRGGARFTIGQGIEMGQPVELTLEMPRLLRAYSRNDKAYSIWGIARTVACLMREDNWQVGYEVGVAFIGPNPPDGYMDAPEKRYDLKPKPNSDGLWPYRELSAREREMMASWG